jgi:hypothetical protein
MINDSTFTLIQDSDRLGGLVADFILNGYDSHIQ